MSKDARRLAELGEEALEDGLFEQALEYFQKAILLERTPAVCSSLAYCLAKARGEFQEALSLALDALNQEGDNPVFYLNYGRVLYLAGNKEQAIRILRKGLEFGRNPGIMQELEKLGIRKSPVFTHLHRDHFLNRYAGLVGTRLNLR
jgi:Flp pilus assembly protein TadD